MPPPGVCLNIIEARQYQDGYGSIGNPDRFLGQDYQMLKQYCINKGLRYLDETFPPDRSSIGQGILKPSDMARVEWLRPVKISHEPFFVRDGISRFDFGQGILGDCWFLASIGALTFQKSIFAQVVPLEQNFNENYCGIFHFRFWRFGKWVDVVIDDKLPTVNGRLIFVQSKDPNEFWPALLQKAYAKVCGSYTDMDAGTPAEAMMDFTGGVHMRVVLSNPPHNLWQLMVNAGQCKTLMASGTASGQQPINTTLPNGLVCGHAYTVTGVKQVKSRGNLVNLVRLWNPWGKGEWNGDWSDRMTIEDFCRHYADLDICGLNPDFLDGSPSSKWNSSMFEGRWVAGTTAGGCMNHRGSFWTNPQYRVKISGQHSFEDGEKDILLFLMQKPDKKKRHLVQNFHIGFSIFAKGKFPASFFTSHAPIAQSKTFTNARDITEFLTVKPGEYLIVPSTFEPNQTSSFIMIIHSKTEIDC
uniref:Calpain catalytic domain-containing protein n=1 Tax=Salarias fasciatus TaxID=181472 RepID=A0A672J9N0_SALFA